MNWLSALFEYLFKLWPFQKLEPWEKGIKITYSPIDFNLSLTYPYFSRIEPETKVELVGPGSHFCLLWFQEIKKESTVGRVMDLLTQTVTLQDGTQASFSVNIEFEIADVEANITLVHAFKHSLEAAARIHLAKRIRGFKTWEELIAKQDWLEKRLAETLTTRAARWGARITEVGFTDLSKSRTIRLLGDGPQMVNAVEKEEYE